jgi:periplasmic protein TonB
MSNLRVPFAVVAGLLFSSGVFLALFQFVSRPLDIGEPIQARVIEFTHQRADTPVESKRDQKIERPPPPVARPVGPRVVVESGDPGPGTFVHTRLDVRVAGRGAKTPGIDRDATPIVRVPPDYPPRAQARGTEGWVQIRFSVTPTGTVRDPVVIGAEPRDVFEDAALKAIARWRYNPRVDAGVAVERVGLETVIRFELEK